MEPETKMFTITARADVMRRIERLLALLHYNSGFGHSGVFAMALDCDGSEKVNVSPIDPHLAYEVELIGGVGYDIEVARDHSYSGYDRDKSRESRFYTGPAANLYRNGELRKTIPSKDWKHYANEENQGPKPTTVRAKP